MALGVGCNCKEKSIVVKIYIRKRDGVRCRFEHCINKGCGYKQSLPFPEQVKEMLCVS